MAKISSERVRLAVVQNGVLFALIVLVVLFAVLNPRFMSFNNLQTIVLQIAELGLISLPVAFLIMQANVDLSVGSVVAFAGVAGLILGIGLSFARHSFDWTIRSPRHIRDNLGIECVGELPPTSKHREFGNVDEVVRLSAEHEVDFLPPSAND